MSNKCKKDKTNISCLFGHKKRKNYGNYLNENYNERIVNSNFNINDNNFKNINSLP